MRRYFQPFYSLLYLCASAALLTLGACDNANSCEVDDDCFAGEFCYEGTCAPNSSGPDAGDVDADLATMDAEDSGGDTPSSDSGDTIDDARRDTTSADADDATDVDASSGVSVVSLAAGGLHTCALLDSGEVMCWGDNNGGALGNGDNNAGLEETPVYVSNIVDAIDIDSGHLHACAIRGDQTVWCWGSNGSGQIDTRETSNYYSPHFIDASGIAQVKAGDSHTCIRSTSGDIQCRGNVPAGGTNPPSGLAPVTDIAAGNRHSCAIADGRVYCWGQDSNGKLGDGTPVSGISNAVDVVAGYQHTCVRLDDGTVKCWGSNDKGQLGNANASGGPPPITVANLTGVAQIDTGFNHTCIRTESGAVACWGQDGESVDSNEAETIFGLNEGVSDISVGTYHSCAVDAEGVVRCWGLNSFGQLGDGTQTSRRNPVKVAFE